MKKVISLFSLVCVFNFIIVSCGSDDNNSEPQQPEPTFSMSVNGQTFLPNSEPSAQISNSGNFIVISAANITTSETITISVGNSSGSGDAIAVGTYTITGNDDTSFNYFDGSNGFQGNNGGQIEISVLDTEALKISGTFQGVATGSFGSNTTYTISNGSFANLSYTVQ